MERYKITKDGSVYYVTFTVIDWLSLFVREETFRIITDSLNYCIKRYWGKTVCGATDPGWPYVERDDY